MKCKDCTIPCHYRTSDREKECEFQNRIIQAPDEWQSVRIQAAIAAMQGVMTFFGSIDYNRETIAKLAVEQADALIAILKKEAIAGLEKQGEKKAAFEMKTPEESLGIDSDTYNKIVDECVYGEQKPAWTPMDEQHVENLLAIIEGHGYPEEVAWLNSLKDRVQPKQEWSEEDEQLYNDLSDTYFYNDEDYPEETYKLMLKRVLDWMNKRAKFLRPQNTWKPSLSQLNALGVVAKGNAPDDIEEIKSLYNDLKKLKG